MNLNKYIDHTLLAPGATCEQIVALCREAKEYDFYSVCVNPCYVELAAEQLAGSDVKIAAVCGFPLGASASNIKALEAEESCKNGASEIDMVINIGMLKSGDYDYVLSDIKKVVDAAATFGSIVKVILETCLLTEEEIVRGCQLAEKAGAHFVKTSTGFSSGGATVEDVKLLRKSVGDRMQVKASGGIRDYETAISMINAGADRLGTSASIAIVKGAK